MDPTVELPGAGPTDGGALVLGRYRLGSRLGSGGFGTVFAARDERLDRIVAVKVIPAGAAADGLDARGRREALAAARLDHPGIVSVYDAGEDGEARYVISELVQGATLDKLQRDGALSDRDVLRIGLTLAAALAHAHDRGVIHRDVKPQNVIVPEVPDEGRAAAKLTDFGVAHLAGDEPLTMTGDVVGTLAYMAPEQAAGERIDDRADLYALALVLYEALAGVNPVRAGSPAATARRVGTVLPPLAAKRPELPRRLCAAIDRALRPDPEDRGELEDLEDAFEDALLDVSDEGGTIAPLPLERRGGALLPGWASRPLAALAAGALAAVVAASLGRPPAEPAAAGAAVAAAVLVLPRLGWIAAAVVAVAALAGERPGVAALTALAALAAVLLARRAPLAWSLPAAAPVLGLAGLAGAYPALAGRATRAPTRAGLGAAGAVWVLLAQPALGRALVLGMRQPEPRWDGSAGRALQDAVWPLLSSGAALLLVVWALGALVLPWLVRGRVLALDVVAAAAWAAALAGATAALAERTVGPGPGVLGGALLAAGVAVLLPRARRSHGIL